MNLTVFNKPILHGRSLCSTAYFNHFKKNLPKVKIPSNLKILTVNDKISSTSRSLIWSNCEIHSILLDEYIKWISKVDSLYNYILKNFKYLPDYIMYLDGFDTIIINDIPNISNLLNFYKCKILFNSEYGYWHTGFFSPTKAPAFKEACMFLFLNLYLSCVNLIY